MSAVTELKKQIKEERFARLYVFYGSEGYLRNHYRGELIKKCINLDFAEFNLHQFEGKNLNVAGFLNALETYPTFDQRKLIIISNLVWQNLSAADQKLVTKALSEVMDSHTVVFDFDETTDFPGKQVALKNMLQKAGALFCEFDTPGDGELSAWVRRHCAAHKKIIGPREIEYLLQICDHSMLGLSHEIEKICRYCPGEQVGRREIDAVVAKSLEARVFDLTGYLAGKNYDAALTTLEELFERKEEPVMILGAIANCFTRLVKVKACMEAGMPDMQTGAVAGLKNSYALKINKGQAKNFSMAELKAAVLACRECDAECKRGRMDNRRALELLVGRLMQGEKTRC